MLPLFNALHFVVIYVNDLVGQLKLLNVEADLSRTQKLWLSFVLSAIIVSNTICWSVFERMCNGKHKSTKLLGMFRRGVICWDNAVAESFFRTLKTECVYHEKFTTREQAKQTIFEYIEVFYNRKRRHSNNNYLSPVEFEQMKKSA